MLFSCHPLKRGTYKSNKNKNKGIDKSIPIKLNNITHRNRMDNIYISTY